MYRAVGKLKFLHREFEKLKFLYNKLKSALSVKIKYPTKYRSQIDIKPRTSFSYDLHSIFFYCQSHNVYAI